MFLMDFELSIKIQNADAHKCFLLTQNLLLNKEKSIYDWKKEVEKMKIKENQIEDVNW